MAVLEAAARGLLSDPTWNRVFKNTYDAIEEQLNKILVSVAAVGLAVNLSPILLLGTFFALSMMLEILLRDLKLAR